MLAIRTKAVHEVESLNNQIRVLLVEDDNNDKELILLELRRGGFEPVYKQVKTAEAFSCELKENEWDIILCDYSLPSFDGLSALKIVRDFSIDIPFILISGEIADNTAVQAMKNGANDYLMKDNLHRLTPVIERELKDVQIRKEHKKTQLAIVESERRLREAERIAHLGHWELDHSSLTMVWSSQLYQIFEITDTQTIITYKHFLSRIHPEDRIKTNIAFKQSVENQEPLEVICRLFFPGKKDKYVRIQCENIYDDQDNPLRSLGVIQDVSKSIETQIELKHSLNEKQVLISEIHHRVKNNLALIFSLLQLEMSDIQDEQTKTILFNSIMRIRTMSLIHEKLYSISDFSNVPFHTFTNSLTQILGDHYNADKRIKITLELDEVLLNVNQAMPAALILNEILTNAFNHAFEKESTGHIIVELSKNSDQIRLKVSDNGKGISNSIHKNQPDTLGLTIINLLTQQLNGILSINKDNGSIFSLQFTYKKVATGSSGTIFPAITPHLKPYRFGELNDILL